MKYQQLGNSDLKVSRICLGTMTFGNLHSEAESFEQMDYAVAQGVNFLDTAEMYPIPTHPKYQGRSEEIVGNWLKQRGNRDQMIVATKVTGPGDNVSYIRPDISLDRRNIRAAITESLKRLQTDYVDLYQLHWPDRQSTFFGSLMYQHDPSRDGASLLETLQALGELVDEGLVRHIGLSNETPWGTMTYLRLAEQYDLPKVVSVQNPYNLLNRTAEVGLTEALHRENVDLLAYSPLGFGVLSGKYLGGQFPPNSRLTDVPTFKRYLTEQGIKATEAYVELAREAGWDPAMLALAWVNSRPFLASNIIGTRTMDQLRDDITSVDLELPDSLIEEIEAIHTRFPFPCP